MCIIYSTWTDKESVCVIVRVSGSFSWPLHFLIFIRLCFTNRILSISYVDMLISWSSDRTSLLPSFISQWGHTPRWTALNLSTSSRHRLIEPWTHTPCSSSNVTPTMALFQCPIIIYSYLSSKCLSINVTLSISHIKCPSYNFSLRMPYTWNSPVKTLLEIYLFKCPSSSSILQILFFQFIGIWFFSAIPPLFCLVYLLLSFLPSASIFFFLSHIASFPHSTISSSSHTFISSFPSDQSKILSFLSSLFSLLSLLSLLFCLLVLVLFLCASFLLPTIRQGRINVGA